MVAPAFVHTHVHSHYSLLDGAAQIEDLVDAAAKAGQPALALTDHGNLCGAITFYKACKAKGVKPIVGLEAYLAPKSRFDRAKNPVSAHHLILLAMNEVGYRNLIKLSSRSFTEGFYYVPRVDKELLAQHHEGLIAQSACLSGEPCYYLRNGDLVRASAAAGEMKAIFGDRYYLELQRNGCDGQEEVNQGLVRIAREQRIPLVATNDVHYVSEDDRLAHEVHMCIGMGRTLKDQNRLKQDALVCFKASEPMYAMFRDLEEAPRSTLDIAARCDLRLDLGKFHLPKFTPPGGEEPVAYFRRLCRDGTERRYGRPLAPVVEARLAEEASVIEQMGFVSYFLIVWDFIRWSKEHGIPVGPGRGSAAGSLIAYALGITDVDPLKHDLLFERFLNRERISMPDIDIDFCKDGREEVIRYVQEKYGGRDRVSQIVTFGTMAARAVIRDVGRVLDVPLKDVDALAKKVPNGPGADLGKSLESDPDLKAAVAADERFQDLVKIARRLEGLNRNASKHAAGVVIADAPLEEYVPLYRVGDDITTQFTMDVLEEIGLLKMDFLGLRTLTILAKAVANVRRLGRTPPDLAQLPDNDPDTFKMLARGEALGVFQLESSGMRDLLSRIRPDRFEDLSAIVALFRPGPLGSGMVDQYVERKHGRQEITYLHARLAPILKETLGVIVYQEQVMRVANVLAGFSLNEADSLRKAMGKKKPEVMAKFKAKFVDGCKAREIPEDAATEIWTQMEFFAGYGFNKSHTVAYAVVTYQTAYMKCHEPRAFMAALLTCECGDRDKLAEYIDECRRMGIKVLPPDASRSEHDFTVEGAAIRYGLGAIKGVGEAAARAIVAERERGGPYASVYDLCERVDAKTMNRATLEALVHAGAFDASGARRSQLLEVLDRAMKLASEAHADRSSGQTSLFGGGAAADAPAAASYPDVPELAMQDLLAAEKDALGYYVTSHPLAKVEPLLRRHATGPTSVLKDAQEKQKVVLGGLVTQFRTSVVKQGPNEGKKMAFFRLEDFAGSASCVIFTKAYAAHAPRLANDRVVFVEGDVDTSRDEPTLRVSNVVAAGEAPLVFARGLLVRLLDAAPGTLDALKSVLQAHAGPLPVAVELQADPRRRVVVKAAPSWSVAATDALLAAVHALPGVRAAEWTHRDI